MMKNVKPLDRLLRALLAVAAIELAVFWLAGTWQIVAYVVGAILIVTAATGFCPLYSILGIRAVDKGAKSPGKAKAAIAAVLLVVLAAGGSYASYTFTRKLFLEDFNAMNDPYKKTLFQTGRHEREKSIANYEALLPAYQRFQQKYSAYQPYALRSDKQLSPDLVRVAGIIAGVSDLVRTGDLQQAHIGLEAVRPVFQEMFKRNGFSMLSVALVDFHDVMETMLDAANAKDSGKLVALYPQVSEKLKVVEAESNDAEIQAIRKNLDELNGLAAAATRDQLPARGEALKSSFIKVYLARG
jgi:hypothetical protein